MALRDGPYPLLFTLAYCPASPCPDETVRVVVGGLPPDTLRVDGAGIPEPVLVSLGSSLFWISPNTSRGDDDVRKLEVWTDLYLV